MKELKKILVDFVKINLRDYNWYNWHLDESKIPFGIKISGITTYEKNVDLKYKLNLLLSDNKTNPSLKVEVVKYIVSTWGGIRGNSLKKIEDYATFTDKQIIDLGTKGIASWSKVLSLRNPDLYPIYDARVATALNILQVINQTKDKYPFPLLSSQNKNIKEANTVLRTLLKLWDYDDKKKFYIDYCTLLRQVVSEISDKDIKICTIEMMLFAKAESLYEIFKKN
jgi:hypothetical protein